MAGEELTRALQTTAELPRLLTCRPYQSVGCCCATPKVSSNSRLAVYRSASVPPANPGMVPVALASRSHLPGSPCSPRGGDPTPGAKLGDCPHHSCVIRPVLHRHPACSSLGSSRNLAHTTICLVRQITPHLFRRHRLGAPAHLA